MEIKATLFSVAGFLVPGIVLMTALFSLLAVHYYGSITLAVSGFPALPDGTAFFFTTLFLGSAVAVTAAVGAILSDLFTYVGRQLIVRPFLRNQLRENVKRLFGHQTLKSLIHADMDARESYVYMSAGELDLNWYAGRVRMMGGSGLALLLAAALAAWLSFGWFVIMALVGVGVVAICTALYRSSSIRMSQRPPPCYSINR